MNKSSVSLKDRFFFFLFHLFLIIFIYFGEFILPFITSDFFRSKQKTNNKTHLKTYRNEILDFFK